MTRKERLRRILAGVFCFSLVFTIAFTWGYVKFAVPDRLNLVVSEEEIFHFTLPPGVTLESDSEEVVLGNASNIPAGKVRIQTAEPVSMYGASEGSYHLGMKLFGLIRMKDIQVDVVDGMYAAPCGVPVGIYLKSRGVMVVGTGEIVNDAGNVVEPAFGVLKSGDYIETVNGQEMEDKDDLIQAVSASSGRPVSLEVRRDGELLKVELEPVLAEDGTYKLGAWVRDDTQGIGTVTYVDMNGSFGALGHGISDSDTGKLVDIREGELYDTQIMGIEKGTSGKPGVMSGVIYYGKGTKLGEVTANTEEGIFGTVNRRFLERFQSEAIPVGFRQDVHKGQAFIRSDVSGEVRDYEIEIQKVDHTSLQKNKGMVIRVVDEELLKLTGGIVQGMSGSPIIQDGKLIGAVTHVFIQDSTKGMVIRVVDEELLKLTGGIVQGMSGSPIIQDGKLIGAVTHVFIQDSTKGYGIFIENMLERHRTGHERQPHHPGRQAHRSCHPCIHPGLHERLRDIY